MNPAGADGLLFGNASQLLKQLAAVGITYVIAGVGTFILLILLDLTVGLRVQPEAEL